MQRPPTRDPDTLWTRSVAPWLQRVWPLEPALRSQSTAEQFAQVAIATDEYFPQAVELLVPLMVPLNAFYVLDRLASSAHPDRHPRATLTLIDAILDHGAPLFGDDKLRDIIERVRVADPQAIQSPIFRAWNERLRARQF